MRLHADEEHWIPLSDLMTGLMFLFLLIALAYMVEVNFQHSRRQDTLKTYMTTRAELKGELERQFKRELPTWGARLDPDSLGVRFSGKTGLFATGSADLEPQFKIILNNFFPRYLRIINQPKYRSILSEVRIEGFTSTMWRPGASQDQSYLGNMALSQDRTRSVLQYVLSLHTVQPQKRWLTQMLSADGFSYSHLIRRANGGENDDESQRIEFHVQTNANQQIAVALRALVTPSPGPSSLPEKSTMIVSGPTPATPKWASAMIGKPLMAVFARKMSQCAGYLDGAAVRYTGHPRGVQVSGWAYDMTANVPASRVLLVDQNGRIVGAGNGGIPRPDVPATLPGVHSLATGWEGYARMESGTVSAWMVLHGDSSVCKLRFASARAGQL